MTPEPRRGPAIPDELTGQHATVTLAAAMDERRTDEIEAALSEHWPILDDRVSDGDESTEEPETVAEWRRALDELDGDGEQSLHDKIERLLDRLERAYPSLLQLRFEPQEEEIDFSPGQYVRISYTKENPRVYSVASSPNRDYVELVIRRVPGGHLTPTLCEEAAEGDEIYVQGPYGDELTLKDESHRDMLFVATGTGVAPLHSMIQFVFEEGMDEYEGEKRDVWMVLGSSWRDDLPYHEAFTDLDDEHENFHYVPTLSRETLLSDWNGETDYVQYTLLKYLDNVDPDSLPEDLRPYLDDDPASDVDARIDGDEMELYVCGIGAMCQAVTDVTQHLGIPERYTEVESYG